MADDATWAELFGPDDDEAAEKTGGAQPAAPAGAAAGLKAKKDKKEKKEKKGKKEKRGEKGREQDGAAEEAAARSLVATRELPLLEERVKQKRPEKERHKKKDRGLPERAAPKAPAHGEAPSSRAEVKEKRDKAGKKGKAGFEAPGTAEKAKDKKEKKDKKAKKDKKEKKRKAGGEGAPGDRAPASPQEGDHAPGEAAALGAGGDKAFEPFEHFDRIFDDKHSPGPAPPSAASISGGGMTPQKPMDRMYDDFGADDAEEEAPARGAGPAGADFDAEDLFGEGGGARPRHADEGADEAFDNLFGADFFGDPQQDPGAAPGDSALGVPPVRVKALPKAGAAGSKKAKKATEQEESWPEGFNEKFLKVLSFIKQKRPLSFKDDEAQKFVQEAIQGMLEAAKLDEECFGTDRPAGHKMKLLPKVITIMEKEQFAVPFVTYEGCKVLASWLRNLPDGTLPNVHLRTALLRAMLRLPITKEALANCTRETSLGAAVARLQNNPSETVANRKTAGMLVQKWVKQVLGRKPESFESAEMDAPKPKLVRPAAETEESLRLMELESDKRIHPAIPVIQGQEYVIKPVPRHQPIKRDKVAVETNRGKIREVLKVLSRPNKRAWKPYSVSVAGRTVNAN